MVTRQAGRVECVIWREVDEAKAGVLGAREHVVRCDESALHALDLKFPDADRTDQQLVALVGKSLGALWRQAVGDQPQQHMTVQQEPQSSIPNSRAISSSASSKRDIVRRPLVAAERPFGRLAQDAERRPADHVATVPPAPPSRRSRSAGRVAASIIAQLGTSLASSRSSLSRADSSSRPSASALVKCGDPAATRRLRDLLRGLLVDHDGGGVEHRRRRRPRSTSRPTRNPPGPHIVPAPRSSSSISSPRLRSVATSRPRR